MDFQSFFSIAGGVALLLYGIRLMSEALQLIAGDKMRQLIGTLTKTPLRGIFVGIVVTVLIQSSAGTTVMTVSFVNSGMLTLRQAIGIIMGANIGTTVTAQIIAFKIEAFALPLITLGVLLSLAFKTKSKQLSYLGSGIIGLGLLFMGMKSIGGAANVIANHRDLLLILSRNPLTGVFAGMFLTILVQSSAATIGLTMALALQGLIDLDGAIPIILGDNLGTTFTAVLVAMGASRPAKQAAAAHVLFNLIGTVIFLLCFPVYKNLVIHSASDLGRQIANAHTIFNVINTVIFFPFVSLLAKFIERVIPIKPEDISVGALYLNPHLITVSRASAVEAVKDELAHMGLIISSMLDTVHDAFFGAERDKQEERMAKFEKNEQSINNITQAISSYASEIWQKGISADLSTVLGCYVNTALDIERIGDHAENLIERSNTIDVSLSEEAVTELKDMYETAARAVNLSISSLETENAHEARQVIKELETKIDAQEKSYRHNHIERLNRGECDPERGVNFITLLGDLERIGDHSNNIAGYTLDILALK